MQGTSRLQDQPGLAQRYLAGQLSPSEQEAYEQYFISNPDAVRELEATARMKVGLASLRDSGQLDSVLRAGPVTSRRPAVLALAASVAVIAIAVGFWRSVSVPGRSAVVASATRLLDSSGKPLTVGAIYVLLRTRANGHDAVLELPAEPRALELRVLPESVEPAYDAALSRVLPGGAAAQFANVRDLRPASDGFVRIYVDSSRLEPGSWLLVLSAARGDGGDALRSAKVSSSFRLKVLGAGASVDSETSGARHGKDHDES